TVGGQQPVAEVRRTDQVVPGNALDFVVEPRSFPADAEHRLLIRPRGPQRLVVRTLVDRYGYLDRVVERERCAERLLSVSLRRLEPRIDRNRARRIVGEIERRDIALVTEIERVGE